MDPSVILKTMCRRDSGLEIKDRKWLKIPVPMSFIGDEMLHWLMGNVRGFRSRKAARAYASLLLSSGLIRHIVRSTSFNEKCYYVFDEAIIADRLREDAEAAAKAAQRQMAMASTATLGSGGGLTVGGGAPTESNTTEITDLYGLSSGGVMEGVRMKVVDNQKCKLNYSIPSDRVLTPSPYPESLDQVLILSP